MTEHRSTKGPICPYCTHEHHADEAFFFSEDLTEFECEHCGEQFEVSVFTQTSWTTSKLWERRA